MALIAHAQDRTYVPKEKLQPVYERGLALWLEHVLHDKSIKDTVLDEVLGCIRRCVPADSEKHEPNRFD